MHTYKSGFLSDKSDWIFVSDVWPDDGGLAVAVRCEVVLPWGEPKGSLCCLDHYTHNRLANRM